MSVVSALKEYIESDDKEQRGHSEELALEP